MNVADFAVAALLAAALFFAVRHIRRRGLHCECGCDQCVSRCGRAKKPRE